MPFWTKKQKPASFDKVLEYLEKQASSTELKSPEYYLSTLILSFLSTLQILFPELSISLSDSEEKKAYIKDHLASKTRSVIPYFNSIISSFNTEYNTPHKIAFISMVEKIKQQKDENFTFGTEKILFDIPTSFGVPTTVSKKIILNSFAGGSLKQNKKSKKTTRKSKKTSRK
jgi:hypothetical protein